MKPDSTDHAKALVDALMSPPMLVEGSLEEWCYRRARTALEVFGQECIYQEREALAKYLLDCAKRPEVP